MSRSCGFPLLAACAVQALWLAVSPAAAQPALTGDPPPTLRASHLEPQPPKSGQGHFRIAAELLPAHPKPLAGHAGLLHLTATFAPKALLGCPEPSTVIFSDGFEP